jgi:hypothetical protein
MVRCCYVLIWGDAPKVDERGVADRFSCIDGDLHTTDFGTAAYDIGIYSHIAHQEGSEDNVAILALARFRRALKPGGTLVLSDFIVEDDGSGPPFALLFASTMLLTIRQGTTWRRVDYQSWLTGRVLFALRATRPRGQQVVYAMNQRFRLLR